MSSGPAFAPADAGFVLDHLACSAAFRIASNFVLATAEGSFRTRKEYRFS
jgi:hypothetical protein